MKLVADSPSPDPRHATRALVGLSDGTALLSVAGDPRGDALELLAPADGAWTKPTCLAPDLTALAAFSSSDLWLGAGAKLLKHGGRANAASQGDARVGIGASLGEVMTEGGLSIGLGAQLSGDAIAAGSLMNHGVVAGQVRGSTPVELSGLGCFQVAFPSTTGTVDVLPGVTKALAPGGYARVKLLPRAKLRLRSGTYFIKRFEALPLARVELDTTNGPVRIVVQEQLNMLGR
ncbi:MAG: hypothetical protein KIT72_08375 [Polyangiaceae bacterium]|nr:hypothetical protein [Polyangiaceae bacterium]MCW5790423.1 hypothetical protein [Polyangiaceae bacterium]